MSRLNLSEQANHQLKYARFPLRFYSVLERIGADTMSNYYSSLVKNDVNEFFANYHPVNVPPHGKEDFLTHSMVEGSCRERNGMYLFGPSYTGKTILACFIGFHLIRCHLIVNSVLYINIVDLLDKLRPGSETDPDIMRRAEEADVLIIDDMGTQKNTEWVYERIYMLLDKRVNAMMPMIVTSNYDMNALGRRMADSGGTEADRMFNRLNNFCAPVKLMVRGKK